MLLFLLFLNFFVINTASYLVSSLQWIVVFKFSTVTLQQYYLIIFSSIVDGVNNIFIKNCVIYTKQDELCLINSVTLRYTVR